MSTSPTAANAEVCGTDHYSKSVDAEIWWKAHFEQAAGEVIDFFGGDGFSLEGKRIADIGCGDGITDLAVMLKSKPARLVGFDILVTDTDELTDRAKNHGIEKLPDNLFFATSGTATLPAEDDSFDVAISWSAFEHIIEAEAILKEVRRVLTGQGVLFIQLWPFYDSAHGTHLVDWFPDGFAQYRHDNDEILHRVRSGGDQAMATEMLEIYRTLNRITLDELHAAIQAAGFKVVKVALSAETVHIPDSATHLPLSRSAISGVKLLAIPDDRVTAVEAEAPELVEADEPEPGADERPDPPTPRGSLGRVVAATRTGLHRIDDALARYEHSTD